MGRSCRGVPPPAEREKKAPPRRSAGRMLGKPAPRFVSHFYVIHIPRPGTQPRFFSDGTFFPALHTSGHIEAETWICDMRPTVSWVVMLDVGGGS